jgi:hypothetical protein
MDREWQEEQTEIVAQGPLRWTLRTVGRYVNPDLRENWRRIVEVMLWANRPVLHYRFTYVNDSPEAKMLPGGESTYLVTWYPLPGGAMSAPGQPQGDDYLAYVPEGETTVRTTRLLDLPQQYSTWFHPDPAEQWLDFFDAAAPSCGIGILYPEEPRFGGGLYNDGYREPPIKRDQPFWFLNLPEVFKNRAVPPGGVVSCPILFVPHPGDYHTTQQVWRGLDAVEVFAEEYMGL